MESCRKQTPLPPASFTSPVAVDVCLALRLAAWPAVLHESRAGSRQPCQISFFSLLLPCLQLGSKVGGMECMAAIGFQERQEEGEGEGEIVLTMDGIPAELPQVKALLAQALAGASAAGGAAAPSAAPSAAPAGAQPLPAAGVAAGAGGAGSVDAAALARALAGAMSVGGGVPPGAPGATAHGSRRPTGAELAGARGAGGRRIIRVTPAMLARMARMLETVLLEGGFGGPPSQPS
jgi:hypothetical protein